MVNLNVLVNRQRNPALGRRVRGNSLTALKAVTGARLLASGQGATAEVAAVCTGSTPAYVRAAAVVLKAEDEPLLDRVLRGEISMPKAASQARRVARLVSAHRSATTSDLIAATKILGCMLVPEHCSTAAE